MASIWRSRQVGAPRSALPPRRGPIRLSCRLEQHGLGEVPRRVPGLLTCERQRHLGRPGRGWHFERARGAVIAARLQHRIQRSIEALWVPVTSPSDGGRRRQSPLLDPVLKRPDADAENTGHVFARQRLESARVRLSHRNRLNRRPYGGRSGRLRGHGRSGKTEVRTGGHTSLRS